jgi:hypothetical protein
VPIDRSHVHAKRNVDRLASLMSGAEDHYYLGGPKAGE